MRLDGSKLTGLTEIALCKTGALDARLPNRLAWPSYWQLEVSMYRRLH